jgi:type IV pilus assembly protein PilB
MLIDPPGLLNLSDERYRNDGKPCVKLLAMVILLGIKDRSTEVRFEPGREEFQLRYRCGGVLYDMVPPPLFLHKTITGLLKAMAGLHPDRRAQAGTMQIKVDHATIDARMETQPTEFGENVIVWFQDIYDVHDEAEALLQRFCRKADGNGLPLGEPST